MAREARNYPLLQKEAIGQDKGLHPKAVHLISEIHIKLDTKRIYVVTRSFHDKTTFEEGGTEIQRFEKIVPIAETDDEFDAFVTNNQELALQLQQVAIAEVKQRHEYFADAPILT